MTRDELVRDIVEYIRSYEFLQGDQYGTWVGLSEDSEELARAIEVNYLSKDSDEGYNGKGPTFL